MNDHNDPSIPNEFKAAVVQFDIVNGAVDENFKKTAGQIEQLKKKQVAMTVFPEMVSCGFDNENLLKHAGTSENVLEKWCKMAKTHHMAIAGSVPESVDGHIYNTMYFIDTDGDIKGFYRKTHLFRPTLEHLYFKAADDAAVIDTSFGKIGLAICYDLRFPELFRILMAKGAQIILLCAQWPETRIAHWRTLVQARAVENQLYMVCANRTGIDGKLKFPGGSMIVDPGGTIIADAGSGEGHAVGQVNPASVKAIRKTLPFLDDRRLDIYGSC